MGQSAHLIERKVSPLARAWLGALGTQPAFVTHDNEASLCVHQYHLKINHNNTSNILCLVYLISLSLDIYINEKYNENEVKKSI